MRKHTQKADYVEPPVLIGNNPFALVAKNTNTNTNIDTNMNINTNTNEKTHKEIFS